MIVVISGAGRRRKPVLIIVSRLGRGMFTIWMGIMTATLVRVFDDFYYFDDVEKRVFYGR